MINSLLQIVAPHHCYGCHKSGVVLCANCKYDIKSEAFSRCLCCLRLAGANGLCQKCDKQYFTKAWYLGERRDTLEKLIDGYKLQNVLDASRSLGQFLAESMPDVPPEAVLVPIPTIAPHVRQRGYDHTLEMVRVMQKQLGCQYSRLLKRKTHTVQRGATRDQRLKQAKAAFCVAKKGSLSPHTPYIIVDDVYTTGATINAAAELLYDSGARIIWIAVATREPLD